MLQMHLHQNMMYWKVLDDQEFLTLHNVLNNTMKERTARGLGVRQSASIITLSHENKMFKCGVLDEDTPEKLLKMVIYMLGLHLALRGGVEHNRLRRPGFQCQIVTEFDQETGKEILVYREDLLQKTNQGGLLSKQRNKLVKVFPASDRSCCPVHLFGKYIGLLPSSKSCGKLYLRPRLRSIPSAWYCDQPYGKNKVATMVKKLCEAANIQGKFSNHSLRASSPSRMYHEDVP